MHMADRNARIILSLNTMSDTTISAAAPPPYTSSTPASETSIPSNSPLTVLNNTNLEGIRNSILDNAPVLFIVGHDGSKPLPKAFQIVTVKAPPTATTWTPNLIHACLMFCDTASKGRQETRLFVQSPQRETMEEALLALLAKMQEMLGRRWRLPLSCTRPGTKHVYLES